MNTPGITLVLFDGLDIYGTYRNLAPSMMSGICKKAFFTSGNVHSGIDGRFMFSVVPSQTVDGYKIVRK